MNIKCTFSSHKCMLWACRSAVWKLLIIGITSHFYLADSLSSGNIQVYFYSVICTEVDVMCLFVPSVPPAPNLELEPLNCTSVTVRWHLAPSDAIIQGYRLSFHPDGQSEDSVLQLPPHDHQHTVTGLSEWHTFTSRCLLPHVNSQTVPETCRQVTG